MRLLEGSLGLGVVGLLLDDEINEIYVNPGDAGDLMTVWSDGKQGKRQTRVTVTEGSVQQFLSMVASERGVTLSATSPHLQAQLPPGKPFHKARLQGMISPVVKQSVFVIRKHAAEIFDLDSYVSFGTMSAEQREAIQQAVEQHENIVVVGGTGSGKTTLANAVLKEIAERSPDDRIVILEDTAELQCEAKDALFMTVTPEVSMKDLVFLTLRCTPNRIVVGEVRNNAAYDLLDAWATGHPGGVCTVHAETPTGALDRLHRLADQGMPDARHKLIAEAVGMVVVIERKGQIRRIAHLVRVNGWSEGQGYDIEPVLGTTLEDAAPLPTSPVQLDVHSGDGHRPLGNHIGALPSSSIETLTLGFGQNRSQPLVPQAPPHRQG